MGLCSAACVSAVVAAGCGGAGAPRAAAPPTPAQRLNLGVVGIEARIGSSPSRGSGFVLDGDRGLVLTTAHTVWGARSLKIATALGVLHGRIVARAPCDDLAVLELEPRIPGLIALPGAAAPPPSAGQVLRSVGRGRTGEETSTAAVTSIPVRAEGGLRPARAAASGLPPQPAAIPLDSRLVPAASGGPVLDRAGRLV